MLYRFIPTTLFVIGCLRGFCYVYFSLDSRWISLLSDLFRMFLYIGILKVSPTKNFWRFSKRIYVHNCLPTLMSVKTHHVASPLIYAALYVKEWGAHFVQWDISPQSSHLARRTHHDQKYHSIVYIADWQHIEIITENPEALDKYFISIVGYSVY